MAWYKTEFYRQCWTYSPAIKQTAEVVFEMESSLTDENCNEFLEAAYEALWEQSGWKTEQQTPHGGFSSALGGREFTKIEIPHEDREIAYPSEGKPVIACTIKEKTDPDHSYRATAFYKFEWHTPEADGLLSELKPELFKPRWRLVPCLPEEAQVVSGSGVCGVMAAISEVEVSDLVNWSDLAVKQAQGQYEDEIADRLRTEEYILRLNWDLGPTKAELIKTLNLRSPE